MISATVLEEVLSGQPVAQSTCFTQRLINANSCASNSPVSSQHQSPTEELWVYGSRVDLKRSGRVVSTFSGTSRVIQAIWATFVPDLTCIVIRDTEKLRIFTLTGEEFRVSLPFPISNLWSTRFGLILEREQGLRLAPSIPSLLVLHHPLDDLTRVIVNKKHCHGSEEWTNDKNRIIFTCHEPSLCLSFNNDSSRYSIWSVRRASCDDLDKLGVAPDLLHTPATNTAAISSLSGPGSLTGRRSGLFGQRTSCQTPSGSVHMSHSALSGRHTPLMTPGMLHNTSLSLNASTAASPITNLGAICRSTASSCHNYTPFRIGEQASTLEASRHAGAKEEPQPPEFTLAFDELNHQNLLCASSVKAEKVFVARDAVDQSYLCYLVKPDNLLRCVKYGIKDDTYTGVTFYSAYEISALDATNVTALGMILALDVGRLTTTLYSGPCKVAKVYVHPSPNIQMANIANEIAGLKLDTPSNPKLSSWSSYICRKSPEPDAGMNDLPAACLPLPKSSECSIMPQVESMCEQAIGCEVLLLYSNGVSLRVLMPKVSSYSAVNFSLRGLLALLPKDVSLQLFAQWYAARNAIGSTNMSFELEWDLFINCLLSQLGYHVDKLNVSSTSVGVSSPSSPTLASVSAANKKVRHDDDGSDLDWQFLLQSSYHCHAFPDLNSLLGLGHISALDTVSDVGKKDAGAEKREESTSSASPVLDPCALLFNHFQSVLWALHLVYEDMKLNKTLQNGLPLLAKVLSLLAADMKLDAYVLHYWQDFPYICLPSVSQSQSGQIDDNIVKLWTSSSLPVVPPSIHDTLSHILAPSQLPSDHPAPYPVLADVCSRSKDLIITHWLLANAERKPLHDYCVQLDLEGQQTQLTCNYHQSERYSINVVDYLVSQGYTSDRISTIPAALVVPILSALYECRIQPPNSWSEEAYLLIGRKDLACEKLNATQGACVYEDVGTTQVPEDIFSLFESHTVTTKRHDIQKETIENVVTDLRWPKDKRCSESFSLLQSSKPIILNKFQMPEASHQDYQEREKWLKYRHVRRLALSVGRGAMVFQTSDPVPTETLHIPNLQLKGTISPLGQMVSCDFSDAERWPYFHNGVAAGLSLMSKSSYDIDSSWIQFNNPSSGEMKDKPQEGGFLMALGLTGHLSKLDKSKSFNYLIRGDENIAVGILLGLAAAKVGTMDTLVTKEISTHLEALLPAIEIELPISHTSQVASLVSLGLLYMESGHRHMAEVCLTELSRYPGQDTENCVDRESYSLAAGLSLGMITLGQGNDIMSDSLSSLNLAEALYYHMVGGPRPAEVYSHVKHKMKSPSFQIQEGDSINIDITSPGATMALGLMFLRTGNATIASWMNAPESQFLLKYVRPDFLMLRTLAKGLIMWDSVQPTREWIDSHVPAAIRPYCMVRPDPMPPVSNIDYETINQAYCHIIAGAALAMAIRFAGTHHPQAFEVIHHMVLSLHAVSKRSIAELAGKATVEQTLCILVLALGIVMAGSGDLEVIRIIRFLGSRVGPNFPTVTYGSHMALHLALGLLFLGGGRFNLSTEPRAVAAMICAFYPKFPTHSLDNRYHLQALRHLYVLAAEPRLLIPRDVDTGQLVACHFRLQWKNKEDPSWQQEDALKAPFMLPELKFLSKVILEDARYHQLVFDVSDSASWQRLQSILSANGIVDIKQKAGCLSYQVDPFGFRSFVGQCLAQESTFQWTLPGVEMLNMFSSEPLVNFFSCSFISSAKTGPTEQSLGSLLYDCVRNEKVDLLPVLISIYLTLWQLQKTKKTGRPVLAADRFRVLLSHLKMSQCLIPAELLAAIEQKLKLEGAWPTSSRRSLQCPPLEGQGLSPLEMMRVSRLDGHYIHRQCLQTTLQHTPGLVLH